MKTVIVGAGAGGIASALYASLRGEEVTLYEAHSELGGCASYFKRGKFVFDVGATTLSGVNANRPLGHLFSLLGETPKLRSCDPGMVIHLSDGRVLHYYSDFEKWMMELEKNFPHLEHRKFWQHIHKISNLGWEVLNELNHFPPKAEDYLKIIFKPKYWQLLSAVLVSTEMMLKHHSLTDPAYLELINGILIISAQAQAGEVPFLVGAMSLSYPAETFYPEGGMKGLMDFFETQLVKRKVKIEKKQKLLQIKNLGKLELDFGTEARVSADQVVLNLPIWNIPDLINDSELLITAEKKPGHWGAFTLYFGIESQIPQLYQQVHLNHPQCANYFISLSHPEDHSRAPENFQTVTISTHVEAKYWFALSNDEYQIEKIKLRDLILNDFQERFKIRDVKFLTAGTPKSFKHYTHRSFGLVGGIPWLYGQNPLSLLKGKLNTPNLYMVGDTIFPGQGIVGVVQGARLVDQTMKES